MKTKTLTPPQARPAATQSAVLMALLFIAVAVVAVRDLLAAQGWITGSTWTGAAIDDLDGLTASGAVVGLGILLTVIGLWWMVLAVIPAAPSHHPTQLEGDIWITRAALAAAAADAAEETPGVAAAEARVGRVRLVVTAQSDRPDIGPSVEARVRQHLAGFYDRPLKINIEKVKHDS